MSALKTKSRKVPRKEAEEPSDAHKQRIEEDALSRVLTDTEAEHLLAAAPLEVGPLSLLTPVFVDIETKIDKAKGLSLSAMTLRQYLAATELESIAIGIGDEPIEMFYTEACGVLPPGAAMVTPALCKVLADLTQSKRHVFVAHNAAFDSRGVRFLMGVPHPVNMWCTMEGAMAAWPELPGGFGLANVGRKLQLPRRFRKLELDLDLVSKLRHHIQVNGPVGRADLNEGFRMQLEAIVKAGKLDWDGTVTVEFLNMILGIYNKRDVDSMRAIYKRELARIPAVEQAVGIRTNHQRRHHFEVMQESLDNLIVKLHAAADRAADTVGEVLRVEGYDDNAITHMVSEIFNRGETVVVKGKEVKDPLKRGHVQSIRYARLKNIVNDHIAEEHFDSVSQKKINPVQLARNPSVGQVLEQTTRAGKMVSHLRRSTMFVGVNQVDVELGAWRAHTGRFSSPAVGGRGLNLHNCVAFDSLILTNRGWVPILELDKEDLLWDGQAFVTFDSVTWEGKRSTIKVGAAELTSEQPVLVQGRLREAGGLTPCQQVQCVAGGLSLTLRGLLALPCESAASDAARKLSEWLIHSPNHWAAAGVPTGALLELASAVLMERPSSSSAGDTRTCCTGDTESPIESSQPSLTGPACARSGSTAAKPTSSTSKQFLDGMIEALSWIESTTCEATSPATCDSLLRSSTSATVALLSDSRPVSSSSTTATGSAFGIYRGTTFTDRDVFDLREVGPRHLFICNGVVSTNCPKHDKEIAEPVRKLFHMPSHLCLVRGDLANVEYRIEGLITKCPTVLKMFDPALGGRLDNDPYCLAWKAMTGVEINKKNPIRQVAKEAVLGLGFRMSAAGYAKTLLKALAKGSADLLAARAKGKPAPSVVTEQLLEQIICDSGWLLPEDGSIQYIMKKTGCSQIVAVASYHIHRLFNESHYEFGLTADWLVAAVHAVAQAGPGAPGREFAREQLARAYSWSGAPDPDMIGLEIDDDPLPTYPSVRVRCGPWPRTVIWREPHMRINPFEEDRGARLSIRKANGSFKSFSPQLAIENITQAAARNALCLGVSQLDALGYRDVLHVHDEVMLIVPRTRESVLAAREALLKVFGPGHSLPHKWAILIKPNEVSVTESLYESEDDFDPKKGNRWGRIEQGTPDCLLNLP